MSIRHDHYQTSTHIHLSLYLKGLRDQGLGVGGEGGIRVEVRGIDGKGEEEGGQELKVFLLPPYTTATPLNPTTENKSASTGPGEPQLLLHLSPLYGKLKSQSESDGAVGVRVLNMKIELSLPKANPGESWSALTRPFGAPAVAVSSSTSSSLAGNGDEAAGKDVGDVNGSGNGNGNGKDDVEVDGDKTLLNSSTQSPPQPNSQAEGNSKSDSKSNSKKLSSYSRFDNLSYSSSEDDPASDTDADAANGGVDKDKTKKPKEKKKKKKDDGQLEDFFQGLYGGLSDEGKRAMMKSFTESGGTVLSTDWNDVGSRKVVPAPPDGQEAKKY